MLNCIKNDLAFKKKPQRELVYLVEESHKQQGKLGCVLQQTSRVWYQFNLRNAYLLKTTSYFNLMFVKYTGNI